MKKKNITIVQYNWPLQSFTGILAKRLALTYNVFLFADKSSIELSTIDMNDLRSLGITINQYPAFQFQMVPRKIRNLAHKFINILTNNSVIIKKLRLFLFRKFIHKLSASEVIIAVEKEALVACFDASKKNKLIYYSLELYDDCYSTKNVYQYLRACEKSALSQIDHLIIQDETREQALRNNIKPNVIKCGVTHLPVSVPDIYKAQGIDNQYWRRKFNIKANKKIILYFGLITLKNRGLQDILKSLDTESEYVLVIHGYGNNHDLSYLKEISNNKPVYFSNEFVSEDKIEVLVRSADFGLCWYASVDDNNRHTAFSSEKIALFLRSSRPIITNHSESYQKLYANFNCGIAVENLQNIFKILAKMDIDEIEMQKQSRQAYYYFYCSERCLDITLKNINAFYSRGITC